MEGKVKNPNARATPEFRHVYFIQADGMGLVKIGHANGAFQRLAQLQTRSPAKLTLLGGWRVDDAGAMEKQLHQRYEEYHSHGEWFRLPPHAAENLMSPDDLRAGNVSIVTRPQPEQAPLATLSPKPGESSRKFMNRVWAKYVELFPDVAPTPKRRKAAGIPEDTSGQLAH